MQESSTNLESENASVKRDTNRPDISEACISNACIAYDNQVEKYNIERSYDICKENAPNILVNQLHETIVEMKKSEEEGFKREYSVSRFMIKEQNNNKYNLSSFIFSSFGSMANFI